MTEKMRDNLLKKALDTNIGIMPPIDKRNGLDIPEFREPNFNELTIQKRIIELEKESKDLKTQFLLFGLYESDLIHLQAIDIELQSLKENLKTERLRCSCESKQFTRTVDEDYNPLCGGCGKII